MQPENTARIQIQPTQVINSKTTEDTSTVRITSIDNSTPMAESRNEKLFDHYTICSRIGSGGMGVVYLARDRRLGRFVAVKRLNSQAQAVPQLRERFLHEARAVATLSHVHIVHVYALGDDDDGPFIVMEYVAGPDNNTTKPSQTHGELATPNPPLTLDQHVLHQGQLNTDDAIELLIKIGRAVAYAHTNGVIHRDLKPANILLDKSFEPKIVDFGLARLVHSEAPKLTVPGEKLLSLGYGAPEQEEDASLTDERADVYGLGALLYFVLTGQNPRYFREQDMPAVLREPVAKALATDREQRWQSALEFVEELHKVQTKTAVVLPTIKTTWRCKWCDAVNPLAIKFCAECGWDGSEECPECGEQTFNGVQYCGNCGADARAYESVKRILHKMEELTALARFEKVITFASRAHGFEPSGSGGRKLANRVMTLQDQAEKNIARRAQLKEQIPIEMQAENYERAALFIQQYREISEDKQAFREQFSTINELILKRDLKHAQRAVKNREWTTALRLCNLLLEEIAPGNADALRIRGNIRRRFLIRRISLTTLFVAGLLLIYLLSLPIVLRIYRKPFTGFVKTLYYPGYWIARPYADVKGAQWYLKLWLPDATLLTQSYADPTPGSPGFVETKQVSLPENLQLKQRDYETQLTSIKAGQREFKNAWPLEYLKELNLLMERRQEAGDFEGWTQIQAEYQRFDTTRETSDSTPDDRSELNLLKIKYEKMRYEHQLLYSRKLMALSKKYINELSDIQRNYTQSGEMELATVVNNEIKRVRNEPEQLEAERLLTHFNATERNDSETSTPPLLVSTAERPIQEAAILKEAFETRLRTLEKENTAETSKLPDEYMTKLGELMERFQRAGDYLAWESARNEILRFESYREVMPKDIVSNPPELTQLQQKHLNTSAKLKLDHARAIVATTDNYIEKLKELQRKFTVAGEMEAAASINSEIRRTQSRLDFIEAYSAVSPQGPPAPTALLLKKDGSAEEINE